MGKKIKAILTTAVLFIVICSSYALAAEQTTDTGNGTVNGTPDKFVEIAMEEDVINYGTFTVNDQQLVNDRSDVNGKYVIFDSLKYLSPAQSIVFNEGASNSNIFAKVTYTGENYPLTNGLNNTTWLFVKDTAATGYVQNEITGTLTSGGGGVTPPATVIEIGSFKQSVVFYTSTDGGTTWDRITKDIYVMLGNNGRLYVSDAADLSTASYYTAKGDAVNTPFLGNYFTETSTFPTLAGNNVTLNFGYKMDWDATQNNNQETFSTLVDLPMHAAYNHNWTWNLSIIVEFYSAV
ncbi:MAG: hypothetical protein K0S47_2077 [Herbinix sp.]|jgi:hypothetical protein|nr:hypothetical protein [Herbinix sp.]